jgi:hypothetical protein
MLNCGHPQELTMADPPFTSFPFAVGEGEEAGHIPVPVDPRAVFGRARPPVVVTVAGHRYRSTVAIMSGKVFVPFRAGHRAAAGVKAGDKVQVTLTLDTEPRVVEVPHDLAAALDAASLRPAFDLLSFTDQRERAEAVETAKRPETRVRRIAAIVDRLRPA